MPKCTYCLSELKRGTGMMYVHRTGDIAYYCSNKCYKSHVILKNKISRKLVTKEVKATAVTEKKQSSA